VGSAPLHAARPARVPGPPAAARRAPRAAPSRALGAACARPAAAASKGPRGPGAWLTPPLPNPHDQPTKGQLPSRCDLPPLGSERCAGEQQQRGILTACSHHPASDWTPYTAPGRVRFSNPATAAPPGPLRSRGSSAHAGGRRSSPGGRRQRRRDGAGRPHPPTQQRRRAHAGGAAPAAAASRRPSRRAGVRRCASSVRMRAAASRALQPCLCRL
jgi:hypothetical protein